MRRSSPFVYVLIVVSACRADRGGAAADALALEAAHLAQVAGQWARAETAPVCGIPATEAKPRTLIVLSLKVCLSCRSMGHLMRWVSNVDSLSPTAVITSREDALAVCEFMLRERVTLPVMSFSETGRSERLLRSEFLLVRLTEAGDVVDWVRAVDEKDILRRFENGTR